MTFELNFEKTKQVAGVLLIIGNLFAIAAGTHYVLWRRATQQAFAVLDFDMNDRLPQIQERLRIRQAEVAKAQTQAQASATTPAPAAAPVAPAPAAPATEHLKK